MSGKRYPPEMRDTARTLREEGATERGIAARLGVSRDTVRSWLYPHRAVRSGSRRRREREAAES